LRRIKIAKTISKQNPQKKSHLHDFCLWKSFHNSIQIKSFIKIEKDRGKGRGGTQNILQKI